MSRNALSSSSSTNTGFACSPTQISSNNAPKLVFAQRLSFPTSAESVTAESKLISRQDVPIAAASALA